MVCGINSIERQLTDLPLLKSEFDPVVYTSRKFQLTLVPRSFMLWFFCFVFGFSTCFYRHLGKLLMLYCRPAVQVYDENDTFSY